MAESTSQLFYALLEPQRDHLWSIALNNAGDQPGAEALLRTALRGAFEAFVRNPIAMPEFEARLAPPAGAASAVAVADTAMPAAAWARLWGAIQVDAARLGTAKNLRPDSVLLSADPLLAPKKTRPADDFSDVVPPSRLLVVAGLLLLLAIAVTVFLGTRHTNTTANDTPTTQVQ